MIKAIFIDWGNTFTNGFEKANAKVDQMLAPFDLSWKTLGPVFHKFYILRSTGKIKDDSEFESQIRKYLQKEVPIREIIKIFTNNQEIPLENIEIIKELKKKYKVGILSNNIYEWLCQALKKHNIENLFDSLTVSSKVGARKPDVSIYLSALKELSVLPKESIFVADEVGEDLVTASGLGMKTFWLNQNQGAWGKDDDSEVLKFYKPDAAIMSFRDLPKTIEILSH